MNTKLMSDAKWIQGTTEIPFEKFNPQHGLSKFLFRHLPQTSDKTYIEIGSFPGSFLTLAGELGYELNGVDINPRNGEELKSWLANQGLKTGNFYVGDFTNFEFREQYDVVTSFGFIEHFTNFEQIIEKHAELTKLNGTLIITTPNFAGFIQQKLHKYFDPECYQTHNIKSMHPEKWKMLLKQKGFTVNYAGYFGDFWFWSTIGDFKGIKQLLYKNVLRIAKLLRSVFPGHIPAYACYCGLVAVKNHNP